MTNAELIAQIRAEIERKLTQNVDGFKSGKITIETLTARDSQLLYINSFLDTIPTGEKEVDLEEYIKNEIAHYGMSLYKASYGTFSASEIERIMKRFYELGKKAK